MNIKALIASLCTGATLAVGAGSALAGEGKHHQGEMMEKKFSKMDADGDGMVSRAEYESMATDHFNNMDMDSNGMVSLEEMQQARQQMKQQMQQSRSGM